MMAKIRTIYQQNLEKLKKYCAYQERCHQDVRSKLLDLKVYGDELEQIISDLIQENYLNEERFAIQFAGGKFRIKSWGRIKIKKALKQRRVSDYSIKKAMQAIEEETYRNSLEKAALKYIRERNLNLLNYKDKSRTTEHLLRKGYEYPLVKEALETLATSKH